MNINTQRLVAHTILYYIITITKKWSLLYFATNHFLPNRFASTNSYNILIFTFRSRPVFDMTQCHTKIQFTNILIYNYLFIYPCDFNNSCIFGIVLKFCIYMLVLQLSKYLLSSSCIQFPLFPTFRPIFHFANFYNF